MKKRSFAMSMLAVAIGLGVVGTGIGTWAWFDAHLSVPDNKISGQVEGAYFAYGDGTANSPYGITRYRHMYNLAWLQYLGRFKGRQYYFELGANVDMGGIAIPPIGTTDYPFIGKFDGQDYVVSNFTVSNNFSDLKLHPTNLGAIDANVVKIVGIFGVVGDYGSNLNTADYDSSINQIVDTGFTDFTVRTIATDTLIGMVAGYSSGTISNVAVDVGTVDVKNDADPYDAENLTNRLSDYGIIGYTTKKQQVSRFSSTVYGVTAQTEEQFSVDDQGLAAAGWGGSLDMVSIYNNLKTVWNGAAGAGRVISRGETHDSFGHLLTREETTDSTTVMFPYAEYEGRFTSTGSGDHYYANAEVKTTNPYTFASETTSSFGFVKEEGDNGTFIDITGDRNILMDPSSEYTTDILTDIRDGYLIKATSGGQSHYLTLNGASVADATESKYATFWVFNESAGTIRSVLDDQFYLSCDADGNLSGTEAAPASLWSYSSDIGYHTTVSGTDYALGFNGSDWTTTTYQVDGCYIIYEDKNAYLAHDLSANLEPSNPASISNIRWYKNSSGYFGRTANATSFLGGKRVDTPIKATILGVPVTIGHTYTYTLSNSETAYCFAQNGNYLTFNSLKETQLWDETYANYYLHYDSNNGFKCVEATTTPMLIKDAITFSENINCTGVTTEHVTEGQHAIKQSAFVHSYPTFWPLKNVGDTTSSTTSDDVFGSPDSTNTGYIVGGANYTGDPMGDIRFAAFPDQHSYRTTGIFEHDETVSSLRNSYTSGSDSFSHVYTINETGRSDILSAYPNERTRKLKYPKFDKAAKRVVKGLKSTYRGNGSGSICGLHFMDAQISYGVSAGVDKSAYAERAWINEQSFEHYELPTTCIDFNLKDPGRITFFAGTYFWGITTGSKQNNCFFSLHHVERFTEEDVANAGPSEDVRLNGIKSIKELSLVYQRTDVEEEEYAYKYTDGSFSSNYVPSASYDVMFDTGWIKQHETCIESSGTQNYLLDAAYYFEIPVNAGEYALGSVRGGDGGYLMYLDIGANAAIMNRSVFGEKLITVQDDYQYPLGMAFVTKSGLASAIEANAVDPSHSAFFAIYADSSGSVTLTQTSTAQADLTYSTAGLSIKAAYVYDQTSLHDPGGTLTATPLLRTTTTVEETLYMDFNEAMEETYQTGIVVTTVTTQTDLQDAPVTDTARSGTSYWQIMPGMTTKITDPSQIVFYETDTGDPLNITEAPTKTTSSTGVIQFTFQTVNGVTATVTLTPKTTLNASTNYYGFSGYDVSVVDGSNNPLTVTVVLVADGITITVSGTTYVFTFNSTA